MKHQVRKGETLIGIADKYGVSLLELYHANKDELSLHDFIWEYDQLQLIIPEKAPSVQLVPYEQLEGQEGE